MSAAPANGDTIAAIATARGRGAIGIVKISGPQAFAIAEKLFVANNSAAKRLCQGACDVTSHRLHYGWIRDPRSGERIDEVLLGRMRAPRTYTGEDVAEINGHGGAQVLAAVLEAVLDCGARLAEPGEFTRRALLNGRIDLSQAEAVADLIDARSRRAITIAGRSLKGEIGRRIDGLRQKVVGVLARIEAEIDFGEQIEEEIDPLEMAAMITDQIIAPVTRWIDHYRYERGYLEGLKVAVIGRPNAGKSSLINRLAKKERVIVTEVPGTTRDLVDVGVTLSGLPLLLTDTAGLHQSEDPVESIGIARTQGYLEECELIVFMIDAAKPLGPDDYQIGAMLKKQPVIVVFNKMDLVADRRPPIVPETWSSWPGIGISARYDESLEGLEELIVREIRKSEGEPGGDIVPNLRQSRLLEMCLENLTAGVARLREGGDGVVLAGIEMKEALEKLDRILGRNGDEAVLDEVFNRFCIGK